jgi:hypothetical protein
MKRPDVKKLVKLSILLGDFLEPSYLNICVVLLIEIIIVLQVSLLLLGRWVAKLVAHLLASAALCVRIQTSPKNTKWAP